MKISIQLLTVEATMNKSRDLLREPNGGQPRIAIVVRRSHLQNKEREKNSIEARVIIRQLQLNLTYLRILAKQDKRLKVVVILLATQDLIQM